MRTVQDLAAERGITLPCEEGDPDLMFPESEDRIVVGGVSVDNPHVAAAKAVCRTCPFELRDACLDGALARRELHGVWAATTGTERLSMKRKHRRHAARGDLSLLEAV